MTADAANSNCIPARVLMRLDTLNLCSAYKVLASTIPKTMIFFGLEFDLENLSAGALDVQELTGVKCNAGNGLTFFLIFQYGKLAS